MQAERLARAFHDAYREHSPEFGYQIRDGADVSYEELPPQNRELMLATSRDVLSFFAEYVTRDEVFEEVWRKVTRTGFRVSPAGLTSALNGLAALIRDQEEGEDA